MQHRTIEAFQVYPLCILYVIISHYSSSVILMYDHEGSGNELIRETGGYFSSGRNLLGDKNPLHIMSLACF